MQPARRKRHHGEKRPAHDRDPKAGEIGRSVDEGHLDDLVLGCHRRKARAGEERIGSGVTTDKDSLASDLAAGDDDSVFRDPFGFRAQHRGDAGFASRRTISSRSFKASKTASSTANISSIAPGAKRRRMAGGAVNESEAPIVSQNRRYCCAVTLEPLLAMA